MSDPTLKEKAAEALEFSSLSPSRVSRMTADLDEEVAAGAYRHFNLLYTNCLTTSVLSVERCLIGERFEWGQKRFPQTLNDGDLFRHTLRHAPWAEFLFITFGGTAYDRTSVTEYRLTPESVVQMLRDATIVNDATGERRHVVTEAGQRLVEGTPKPSSPLTPTVVFGLLLLSALLVTAAEWWLGCRRLACGYDVVLFTAQALVFVMMVYLTYISQMFESSWNWYFVATFPLPLLLCRRRSAAVGRLWLGPVHHVDAPHRPARPAPPAHHRHPARAQPQQRRQERSIGLFRCRCWRSRLAAATVSVGTFKLFYVRPRIQAL